MPTNFPNGVSSYGSPVVPAGYFGSTSKTFFVDGATGSNGNDGKTPKKALATVTKALSLCTDKAGDVIYLLNDGNTSGTSRDTATIAWSLDNTHLIGVCAPTMLSQRARISPPTSATAVVTPQLTVSGNGNSFTNISLFEGTAEAADSVCVSVTGDRNYFNNVAMMNMGDATGTSAADRAGSAVLEVTGGEENTFDSCYIGLDTTARGAANANVRFGSAATRNTFRNCFFPMRADATSPLFIDAASANDIDRWAYFKDCMFHNAVNSSGTAILELASVSSTVNGTIIFDDCSVVGILELEADASTNVFSNRPTVKGNDPAGMEMVVFS